ncbi:hypothetical protein [Haloquadratum walsbyi]|nr:hypothetical protein [Haloquadratum walsbyi]
MRSNRRRLNQALSMITETGIKTETGIGTTKNPEIVTWMTDVVPALVCPRADSGCTVQMLRARVE